jgi:hypothetical protein
MNHQGELMTTDRRLAQVPLSDESGRDSARAVAAVARLDRILNGMILTAGSPDAERAWWDAKVQIKRQLGILPPALVPVAVTRLLQDLASGGDVAA